VLEVELTPLHDAPLADPTSRVADALYVQRMLAGVDPAQRAVVVLHYYLDLTLPETAAALGIPVGTAKSRLNRALEVMRITIAGDDELPAAAATQERFA
jgi:RNA polymerase sigma-70 factor (ECF subfamily)